MYYENRNPYKTHTAFRFPNPIFSDSNNSSLRHARALRQLPRDRITKRADFLLFFENAKTQGSTRSVYTRRHSRTLKNKRVCLEGKSKNRKRVFCCCFFFFFVSFAPAIGSSRCSPERRLVFLAVTFATFCVFGEANGSYAKTYCAHVRFRLRKSTAKRRRANGMKIIVSRKKKKTYRKPSSRPFARTVFSAETMRPRHRWRTCERARPSTEPFVPAVAKPGDNRFGRKARGSAGNP